MAYRRRILIDSSFLIARAFQGDKYHNSAVQADATILQGAIRYIALPVIYEVFHFLRDKTYYTQALRLTENSFGGSTLVPPEDGDFERAFQIMRQYRDAELDLTDATIMALAERIGITDIATFDRRDFGIVKPAHAANFTLIP